MFRDANSQIQGRDFEMITSIVTESGVRALKTKPKLRAADTRAPSSGDWAKYSSFPVQHKTHY